MAWFGGKAVFRIDSASGVEEVSNATLVEERVVVLNADDAEVALERLEQLSEVYAAQGTWYNADGELVRTRRLAALDVYRMSGELADAAEIYSRTQIISSAVTDEDVVCRLFGAEKSPDDEAIRARLEPDFERTVDEIHRGKEGET